MSLGVLSWNSSHRFLILLKTLQGIPPKIGECFFSSGPILTGQLGQPSTDSGAKIGATNLSFDLSISQESCYGIFQPKGFSSGSIAIAWDDAQPTTVRLEPLRVFNTNVENAVPLIATRRVFFRVGCIWLCGFHIPYRWLDEKEICGWWWMVMDGDGVPSFCVFWNQQIRHFPAQLQWMF